MQTVVETPGYLKAAKILFSQVERDRIVDIVAANPSVARSCKEPADSVNCVLHGAVWENAAERV
jgi:hypothetical protein